MRDAIGNGGGTCSRNTRGFARFWLAEVWFGERRGAVHERIGELFLLRRNNRGSGGCGRHCYRAIECMQVCRPIEKDDCGCGSGKWGVSFVVNDDD